MTWEIVALHALRLSVPADSIRWDGKERADACARRGTCDFSSGICECFDDFTGADCSIISATM